MDSRRTIAATAMVRGGGKVLGALPPPRRCVYHHRRTSPDAAASADDEHKVMVKRENKKAPIRASKPAAANVELPALKPLRVLVAGEIILDRYLWGDVSRISPEAPIPILNVQRREEKPGNAGFVMANLRALGAEVSALSVIGDDPNGRMLTEILGDLGVDTRAIVTDPNRPTIVKERLLGSVQSAHRGTQQLLRVDDEDSARSLRRSSASSRNTSRRSSSGSTAS